VHRASIPDQPDAAGQGGAGWARRGLLFRRMQPTPLPGQPRESVPGADVAGRWAAEQPGALEFRQLDLSACLAPEERMVVTAQEVTAVAGRQEERSKQLHWFSRRVPGAPAWQEWQWFDSPDQAWPGDPADAPEADGSRRRAVGAAA